MFVPVAILEGSRITAAEALVLSSTAGLLRSLASYMRFQNLRRNIQHVETGSLRNLEQRRSNL
jgi:hypothetical protein